MLKRNQVLLNDWLVDIIKNMSKKYDLSFSEVIRVFLCLQIGKMSSYAYPDLDFKYAINKTKRIIKKKNSKEPLSTEELRTAISELYFETRKAAEMWHEKEKEAKKEKKKSK